MSRFGRKLARLNMPGGATTTVEEADGPSGEAAAPADRFARADVEPGARRGHGWGTGGSADAIEDDSDAIGDASGAFVDASDAIGRAIGDAIGDAMAGAAPRAPASVSHDPVITPRSAADAARIARIARLQARMDAMVGRTRSTLRSAPVNRSSRPAPSTPEPGACAESPAAPSSAPDPRTRPAPAGAWGRLARGAAEHATPATTPTGPTRDPDDFSGVPGALEETEHGAIHIVRETFDPDHCHGHAPVGRALHVAATEVARFALDPDLADVDLSRALYVDTETTGLYGSGTVPFLIGLGWFEGDRFELRQLFLRRLGEERPMLEFVAERLAQASCMITYNGKSFDWPLLCQRFVMNRLPPPPDPLHLDLLHCARRAYKQRLGGARLVQIEERVLGMTRVDDTPGHEIPLIYLDFVRGGPSDRVAGIIEHNAHDIVAMAALLGRLGERFARAHRDDDPRDLLSYARIAERAGDAARAAEFARVAADRSTGAHAADAWLLHARLARRRDDWDEAQRGWEAALAEAADDEQSGAAHLALAKLFEHRRKDFDRALRHAYHTRWMEGSVAWQKRIDRIERKRAQAAEAG